MNIMHGGIAQNADGTLNADYKRNLFESGKAASIITSTGFSMLGAAIGGGIDNKFVSSVVQGSISGIGSSLEFGGHDGFKLTGSVVGSAVNGMLGANGSAIGMSKIGSLAGNLTQLAIAGILGNSRDQAMAAGNFAGGGWGAVGSDLGELIKAQDTMSYKVARERAKRAAAGQDSSADVVGEIVGAAMAAAVMRRRQEEILAQVADQSGDDPMAIANVKAPLGVPLTDTELPTKPI